MAPSNFRVHQIRQELTLYCIVLHWQPAPVWSDGRENYWGPWRHRQEDVWPFVSILATSNSLTGSAPLQTFLDRFGSVSLTYCSAFVIQTWTWPQDVDSELIPKVTLSPPEWFCIQMCSRMSLFNVIYWSWWQSHKTELSKVLSFNSRVGQNIALNALSTGRENRKSVCLTKNPVSYTHLTLPTTASV